MPITDPFILPADVIVVPVASLPPSVRKQFEADDGDFVVTRTRSRTPSRVVSEQVAALLEEFRDSRTIVEAVIKYSKANDLEPEEVLSEAVPVLERFIHARVLVAPDAEDAVRIAPSFEAGSIIQGFTVARCVQALEDSELYETVAPDGKAAALKIARPGRERELEVGLHREASILRRLDGKVNPRLLAQDVWEGRPFLVMEWCLGLPVAQAAHTIRQMPNQAGQMAELLRLSCAILEAYDHLHKLGLLHSDVHPANILTTGSGSITIIDYGLARFEGESGRAGKAPRGGIGYYFEPEFAAAQLRRKRPPVSSFRGEQYALAALIYHLLTGVHYLEFSLEKREMLRQISEDPPRTFVQRAEPWPAIEKILHQALAKNPRERFSSVAEFSAHAAEIAAAVDRPRAELTVPVRNNAAAELVNNVVRRLSPTESLFQNGLLQGPACSVNYGAAGIAYGLYRIACLRDSHDLLCTADLWSTRAAAQSDRPEAFYNAAIEITPETVGNIALYHSRSGVHAVQSLIGHAMGDQASQQTAEDAFAAASQGACDNLDLTLGRSSTLVGCTLLAGLPLQAEWQNHTQVVNLGNAVMQQIWQDAAQMPALAKGTSLRYLGIAHGWAGILYATLLWCDLRGCMPPAGVEERLTQLSELAEPAGRGLRFPMRLRTRGSYKPTDYSSSWCNGSAGQVFLWTQAHRRFHHDSYRVLAERAAWYAWEQSIDFDSLCCGLAGNAYALLNLYRYTREEVWLERARQLTDRAVAMTRASEMPNSLYKGTLGVAVLAADILVPEQAAMPMFEAEGWRG